MISVFRFSILFLISMIFINPCVAKKGRTLNLSNKGISDVLSLKIPKTTRILFLSGNDIDDLSGLKLPSKLKRISLDDNQIMNLDGFIISDSLLGLNLNDNPLNDISSLKESNSIEEVFLSSTLLDDSNFNPTDLPSSLKHLVISINLFENLDLSMVKNLDFLLVNQGKINGEHTLVGVDYSKVIFPDDVKKIGVGSVRFKDDFTGLALPEDLEELQVIATFIELEELLTLKFSPNLKFIDLRLNSLNSLEGVDFPDTLEVLNLNKNQLTTLDDVEIPESIRLLNLKNNDFSKAEKRKIKKRFGKKVKIKF